MNLCRWNNGTVNEVMVSIIRAINQHQIDCCSCCSEPLTYIIIMHFNVTLSSFIIIFDNKFAISYVFSFKSCFNVDWTCNHCVLSNAPAFLFRNSCDVLLKFEWNLIECILKKSYFEVNIGYRTLSNKYQNS